MKKKTVSLILAMMLLVTALSGCGGTGASSKPENNATEAAADAGEKTEAAEPVQESAEPVQEAAELVQEATEPAGEGTKEDVQFAGGSGTAEDPWQIATAEQLDRVRDDLKAHYVLTDDIDLSGYENWIPIGAFQSLSDAPEDAEVPHPDFAFTGTFDGAGHTISNLTVSCEAPMGAGLFGCASGTESGAASIGHSFRMRIRHRERCSVYRAFHTEGRECIRILSGRRRCRSSVYELFCYGYPPCRRESSDRHAGNRRDCRNRI